MRKLDDEGVDRALNVYEVVIPTGLEIEKKVAELRKLQDTGQLIDEKKKSLSKEIYTLYLKYIRRQRKELTRLTAPSCTG